MGATIYSLIKLRQVIDPNLWQVNLQSLIACGLCKLRAIALSTVSREKTMKYALSKTIFCIDSFMSGCHKNTKKLRKEDEKAFPQKSIAAITILPFNYNILNKNVFVLFLYLFK